MNKTIHLFRSIFGNQLKNMSTNKQNLFFILTHKTGPDTVESVLHWKLGGMIHTHKHNKQAQTKHILPVLTLL